MKRLLPVALLLSVFAAPALAGGFSFDLPHLTWPDEATSTLATKGPKP